MPFRRRYEDDDVVVADEAVDDDYYDDRRTAVHAAPFNPAQIIGLIVGLGFTVLGIAAMAQLGVSADQLYQPQEHVWQLPHSPLLGLCELGFGVLMIIASVVPGALRTLMAVLGVVALAFGLVILLDAAPDRMSEWFGVDDSNGWLFTIVGAVVTLAAMMSPIIVPDRYHRRSVRHVQTVR
jgi:hypothetical protein